MKSLENQFLIAMPSLASDYFNKTVTYICEHNDEGAMGLIINMPVNITLHDLLKQIEQNDRDDANKRADSASKQHIEQESAAKNKGDTDDTRVNSSLEQLVLSGGPISQNRGFVLHRTQPGWKSSLALSEDIMITTSKDILMALGTEKAPDQFMVTLGYAGWGPGQLEAELHANSWLTIDADSDILFNTPIEQRWQKATKKLGIDIAHLSTDIGHA
tara:strand:+ start:1237 stop:1884 length:648 start_codon:yes stop_codon:yes gene_type:complete